MNASVGANGADGPGVRVLVLESASPGEPRFALVNHTEAAVHVRGSEMAKADSFLPEMQYQRLDERGHWQRYEKASNVGPGQKTRVINPNERVEWSVYFHVSGTYRATLTVRMDSGTRHLQTKPFAVHNPYADEMEAADFVSEAATFWYLDRAETYLGLAWKGNSAFPFLVIKEYPETRKTDRVSFRALKPGEYAARLEGADEDVKQHFDLFGMTPLWMVYQDAEGTVTGHAIVAADWPLRTDTLGNSPQVSTDYFLAVHAKAKRRPKPIFDYRCAIHEPLPLEALPIGK
ncbi:MAG: hypothetical protein ACFBZ8_13125 [Opitutales bacterium]